jgi:hypothetical protein
LGDAVCRAGHVGGRVNATLPQPRRSQSTQSHWFIWELLTAVPKTNGNYSFGMFPEKEISSSSSYFPSFVAATASKLCPKL